MKRLVLAAVVAFGLASPAFAECWPINSTTTSCTTEFVQPRPFMVLDGPTDGLNLPTPLPDKFKALPPTNFDQGVTFAEQKPTVALGDYAGAILTWLAAILAPIIGGYAVNLLVKLRTSMGQTTTDADRQRLQDIVENGVNLGAHNLGASLQGQYSVEVRNQIAAQALAYAKAHGAETIKALGMPNVNDPKVEEAITARIASTLAQKEAVAAAVPVTTVATPTQA